MENKNILIIFFIIIISIIGIYYFRGLGAAYIEVSGYNVKEAGDDYACYEGININCKDPYAGYDDGDYFCRITKVGGFNNCYAVYTTTERSFDGGWIIHGTSTSTSTYFTDDECRMKVGNDIMTGIKVCFAGNGLKSKDVYENVFSNIVYGGNDVKITFPKIELPEENSLECGFFCKIIYWFKNLFGSG